MTSGSIPPRHVWYPLRAMARRRKPVPAAKPSANGVHALAPEASPPDPGRSGVRWLYLPKQTGGVRVTEDTALTYSAVWACVRVISETLAWLPWNVFRRRADGGRDRQPDHVVDWLLSTQPCPECTAFTFREAIVAHALTWGNGYAEIERDAAGRPLWLWLLTPDRVCPERDARGRLYYSVTDPEGGAPVALPAADVFHLKGLGYDGLVGYSVIRYAARSLGAAMAADQQASSLFANDSTPGGILEHPTRLSDEARANLFSTWESRHAGPQNRRRVAILEEGLKWTATALPPQDSQLLETRQYGPLDVCRWFRVQPHKIAELTRATFSNIEQQSLEHVTDTLMPWAVRQEQEANLKLFGQVNRGLLYTKHNFNALLRGDVAARTAHYHTMLGDGVYSINDVRALEDLNPIGPDGDKRFVPVNMQLLETAGEEPPAPEPAPAADATPPAAVPDSPPSPTPEAPSE